MAGALADISLQNSAKAAGRPRGRPFQKGQSGNPKGKPSGTVNRGTRAAAMLLDGEAETLARKAVEMALSGNSAALRMCLDRTVAPRREQPVSVDLPEISSPADISGAVAAVLGAAARGTITAGEAFALCADDRNLFARDRRHRFRAAPAAIGRNAGR